MYYFLCLLSALYAHTLHTPQSYNFVFVYIQRVYNMVPIRKFN